MKTNRLFTVASVTIILLILPTSSANAQQWNPVEPEHLALKAPTVEKDADAEALLWEVYVNDAEFGTVEYTNFIRIKIFSERGKDSQSKIDIPYFSGTSVKDIAGRTIKPDGSTVELKKDAIFDREVVKFGGFKLKAKSFAMPAIEPGVIIEYRWREVMPGAAQYVRLNFQREIPVQVVRYYLKPTAYAIYPMKTVTFQGKMSPWVKDRNGYYRTEMTNIPAFREEPRMPPADGVRIWMLVYYAPNVTKPPMEYWKDLGKELHELHKGDMKVNDDIRKAAAAAIGDAATPEQKLERLFNFCRTKIKNVNDDASGLTPDQLQKLKDNKSPADTLKRGYGTGRDIDFLFGALAIAAGFDARYAKLSDRSTRFFDPNFTDDYFMRAYNIAVKVGDNWQFFDPASTYVPFGMLRWQEEGIQALVCDSKEPVFVKTPLSPAEKSQTRRIAKLRLTDDGTLEGEVRVEYTGHFAVTMKEDYDDDTPDERESKLSDTVKGRLGGAELSEVRIDSATDPVKPFVYSYKARVPGYAERTGKRLFLQPAFFQKGVAEMFPTSSRLYDIYFQFPWMENDHVEIELPEGYALDNAEAPAGLNIGHVGFYDVKVSIANRRTLVYDRSFRFEGLVFPKDTYPSLKKAFDVLHERDNHAITLKQDAAAAAVKQ
jgi:hypothetical protein